MIYWWGHALILSWNEVKELAEYCDSIQGNWYFLQGQLPCPRTISGSHSEQHPVISRLLHLPQNQWRTVTWCMISYFPIQQVRSEMFIWWFTHTGSSTCHVTAFYYVGNTKITIHHIDLRGSETTLFLLCSPTDWLGPPHTSYCFQPVLPGFVFFSIFSYQVLMNFKDLFFFIFDTLTEYIPYCRNLPDYMTPFRLRRNCEKGWKMTRFK